MKQFLIALALVVVLGGAYYLWQGSPAGPAGEAEGAPESAVPVPDASGAGAAEVVAEEDAAMEDSAGGVTVTFDGSSFSPSQVAIKSGGTVTWTNASGKDMWVASAVHPTHAVYGGTTLSNHCPDTSDSSFDQCAGGAEYSFTFDKVGTWGYHNHLVPSATGRVVVE